jgi:hypothetical protein
LGAAWWCRPVARNRPARNSCDTDRARPLRTAMLIMLAGVAAATESYGT